MSQLHVRQIKAELTKNISAHISMDDCKNIKSATERETILLSRSLAAYALMNLVDINVDTAAKAIVDGSDDGGIDGIYFDEEGPKLYLVQSKWHADGKGSIEQGDAAKFINGVRKVIYKELEIFNDRIKLKEAELDKALDDSANKILLVIVHSGDGELSKHVLADLNDFVRETNDTSDLVSLQVLAQRDIHKSITYKSLNKNINIEVMLKEWAHIETPYEAYYGLVEAADIEKWYADHELNLFDRNLRKFLGRSPVNTAIMDTLLTNPEKFWYLNNGVTLLCESIGKKPLGGSKRQSGIFECTGVSVVNGAQTVGSIHAAYRKKPAELCDAKVAVRIISLENAPTDFGVEVTRATNSQNRIEGKDFVSLDPQQERLRSELWIEFQKKYLYKTGDAPISNPEEGCTLEEATAALACAHKDVSYAVLAKGNIGKFWEDVSKSTYKAIFNPSVSGLALWRAVEFYRLIETELKSVAASKKGRMSLLSTHGNRFIAHHVFRTILPSWLNEPSIDMAAARIHIKREVERTFSEVSRVYLSHYKTAYPANLFKNQTKSKEFSKKLADDSSPS
jgi:hypothetical protein